MHFIFPSLSLYKGYNKEWVAQSVGVIVGNHTNISLNNAETVTLTLSTVSGINGIDMKCSPRSMASQGFCDVIGEVRSVNKK